ncbi:hypothetical protein Tco_0098833 [Tanacetum coccineum]
MVTSDPALSLPGSGVNGVTIYRYWCWPKGWHRVVPPTRVAKWNPIFANESNDDDEERKTDSFDVDVESDVYFLQQAYEYQERLVEEENHSRLTRNPIHRDREGAEERLMGDYFDDYYNSPLSDDLIDDKAPVTRHGFPGMLGSIDCTWMDLRLYSDWGLFVVSIKRRCRDLSSDGVRDLATASGRGRLKEDLESST